MRQKIVGMNKFEKTKDKAILTRQKLNISFIIIFS